MTSYDWILGLAIMFGLALSLNYITFKNTKGFFIFLTIFNAFVVYGNLLPLWSLILNLIIFIFILYSEINQNRGID